MSTLNHPDALTTAALYVRTLRAQLDAGTPLAVSQQRDVLALCAAALAVAQATMPIEEERAEAPAWLIELQERPRPRPPIPGIRTED